METESYPEVTFTVAGLTLSGKLYLPHGAGPFPAVLLYHGYKSCRQQYGLLARDLVTLGMAVFAFNFRGCGRGRSWSEGDIHQQTIADQLADALAAYDYLVAQPSIDAERVACFGNSLGGYLAACVSQQRTFASLILSSPAIYADAWRPRVIESIPESEIRAYRQAERLEDTDAIQAIQHFTGSLLVIRHAEDSQVPERVPVAYFEAAQQARRRELRVLEDTDHQATPVARQQRNAWVAEWFKETTAGPQ